ncbi:MAG TPA: hypothetical protein VLF67_01755 [Candidatus Saccharimonas sp.]|nr:hypothetical protein [Candidatus Saccharimonas sp.]
MGKDTLTPMKPVRPVRNKWLRWAVPAVAIVALGVVGVVGWKLYQSHNPFVDTTHPPQFVTADFIDLSKIFSISKFRSLQGHDFSGGGETCRSMKHYVVPQHTQAMGELVAQNGGIPPKPDGKTDVDIFSPFDGQITRIDQERTPVGEQIYLRPDTAPAFELRLFHVFKVDGIKVGAHVKAGQKLGVISSYSDTDISVEGGGKFISVFQVMTDKVFAEYQARGAQTRDDFIISREYRDAHAVTCDQSKTGSQKFDLPANYDPASEEVHLSGYVAPQQQPTGNAQKGSGHPLVITQWGVQFAVDGVLSNLQYQIIDGAVKFYTPELYPKYQACGPTGGLGALSRVAASADTGSATAIKAGSIGGYNYYYTAAQQPCVQNAAAASDEQLEQDQHNMLITSMRDLTLKAAQ